MHCYIDDIATSFGSKQKAICAKQNVENILSIKRFSVEGWHSNSQADQFPADVETDVLGQVWSKFFDTF